VSRHTLDLHDIQGIVLFAYASMPRACYLHASFAPASSGTGSARPNAWLAALMPDVRPAHRHTRNDAERVHVALSYGGLARLTLSSDELATFPRELQQGMGHPLRARVLGDVGENAPERWEVGGPGQPQADAILLLFARDAGQLAALRARLVADLAKYGGRVVHEDSAEIHDPAREPFGFKDGIAQPYVAGNPRSRRAHEVEVPAGEFVLGYPNAYGELPATPAGRGGFDLGRNGSYLVYRKLRQATSKFWQAMLDATTTPGSAEADDLAATRLAARLVGRWPSGAPLVTHPDSDPGPAPDRPFGFAGEDPLGTKCPFGAHIRRANPRDMLAPSPEESLVEVARHRILRRGRPYGPVANGTPRERAKPDGAERGLIFLALNASFRRQFEFIQQTWVNNPKFAGMYDERDPLVSTYGQGPYTLPASPARRRLAGLPPFVTVLGGGYFFMPGLRALEWLSRLA
jgi:Dyp-type peroxidase family